MDNPPGQERPGEAIRMFALPARRKRGTGIHGHRAKNKKISGIVTLFFPVRKGPGSRLQTAFLYPELTGNPVTGADRSETGKK